MRLGYSMLHAEEVLAHDLDYGDCARYQVVCPNCREALFKRVREVAEHAPTHYLAHYSAKTAEERQCEMRVSAMASAHLARTPVIGRGQSLGEFERSLHEAIVRAQANLGLVSYDLMWADAHRILARPDLATYVEPVNAVLRAAEGQGNALTWSVSHADVVDSLKKMTPFKDRSPFWLRRQASYGLDLLTHVTTSQGERSFKFLAACVYSLLCRSPNAYPPPDGRELGDYAVKVATALCHGASAKQLHELAVAATKRDVAVVEEKLRAQSADVLEERRRAQEARLSVRSDRIPNADSLIYRQAAQMGLPSRDPRFIKENLMVTAGGEPFYRQSDTLVHDAVKKKLVQLKNLKKQNRADRRRLLTHERELEARAEKLQHLQLAIAVWAPFMALICAVEARIER